MQYYERISHLSTYLRPGTLSRTPKTDHTTADMRNQTGMTSIRKVQTISPVLQMIIPILRKHLAILIRNQDHAWIPINLDPDHKALYINIARQDIAAMLNE
jgi:hypothetical protein